MASLPNYSRTSFLVGTGIPTHSLAKPCEVLVRYRLCDILLVTLDTPLDIVLHVPESCPPDMICVNICNAAAPRATPRHKYAGTS